MSVVRSRLLEWPEHRDARGALVAMDRRVQIPFPVNRVCTVYDVPWGAVRGGHATRTCHELFVAVGGRVEVRLDDGVNRRDVVLERPTRGLHVVPMTWLELRIDPGAICMVLCSHPYDENDYIRSRGEFLLLMELSR